MAPPGITRIGTNMNEINRQVENFIKYVSNGWETKLAFDCCYDMIYDMISAEQFLILCIEAWKAALAAKQS